MAFSFSACSDDCVTCSHENQPNNELEICDDSDITYTDLNGNPMTFSEVLEFYESNGFNCN